MLLLPHAEDKQRPLQKRSIQNLTNLGTTNRCARDNQPLPQERYAFLSTTYVGHTIMPTAFGPGQNEPLRMENHVFLDSEVFKAAKDGQDGDPLYGLTLWCHTENRGWLLNGANNIREIG